MASAPRTSSPTPVPPASQQDKRPSSTTAPLAAPSIDLDILDDEEERCKHPIHPAYASTYSFNLCPVCLTTKRIRAVRIAEFAITNHKGRKPWAEHVRSTPESTKYENREKSKAMKPWKF
ncbi:hypothetical protein E8E12_000558 [Didymella heteroderae]|uniref:Uncharacterized protein n=1 Tax=Didymella heteroderae TaxID=1769908 RepID=A0A9P5BXB9_9PLEO|nr:hypothetical protein E8E12_000558 [Didymella heteroderae]